VTKGSSGIAPPPIRGAGAIVALQGAAAVVIAVVLLVRTVRGGEESATVGYGTAGLFAVLGAGVLAAGVALLRSMRGGRGPALVIQALLLPVVWSLLTASAQVPLGLALGVVVLTTTALLLCAPARRWAAAEYPAAATEPRDDER